MSGLWTPPKHIYRGGENEEPTGQMRIPGIGVDHQRPAHGKYVKPGSDLFEQYNNPHVWGANAGHHNPFQWHEMGDELENRYPSPSSVHDWEHHDYTGFDEAQRHLQRLTDKSHPVIRASSDVLHKVLDDGRLKSQFETNSSNGMLSHSTRAGVEEKNFGYPDHLKTWGERDFNDDSQDGEYDENEHQAQHPNHARPIYGYLSHEPQVEGDNADQYGEHKLVLHKPSVWHRTTTTFGDSLNGHGAVGPSPAQHVSPYSFHPSSNDSEVQEYDGPQDHDPPHTRIKALKHFGQSGSHAWGGTDSNDHPKGMGYNYAEAQFHGGVKTSDIHYAVLAEGKRHNDDLKKRLHEHGIPWVEAGRSGYPYSHSGGSVSKEALFNRTTIAIVSYLRLMESHAMGQVMVVAQQGSDRFLLSETTNSDAMARVADTTNGTLSGEFPLQSLLGRGYWEDPQPGVNAEAILALVKP